MKGGLVFAFLLLVSAAHSQENGAVTLRDALMLKAEDYYHSMSRMDPVEASIVYGEWRHPTAGESVSFPAGETRQWRKITADSAGWFNEPDLRGGYAYVSIHADRPRVIILEGMGYRLAYVNGELRIGNMFHVQDTYEDWQPRFDIVLLPVALRAGRNDLLVFGARVPRFKVRILDLQQRIFLNERDTTLPDILVGRRTEGIGSIVVVNAGSQTTRGLAIHASIGEDQPRVSDVPPIQPYTVRKVKFEFTATAAARPGTRELKLVLVDKTGRAVDTLDEKSISLGVKNPNENHKRTFLSEIDGSVQYFGLNPAKNTRTGQKQALFLSIHGAGVEAINQSASYAPKDWGHIVSPTNRRPYGFNWEDWGRMDALETYRIAMDTLNIDPNRIYLTGHSMGGHGVWHIGSLYPDKFAALGPSAGWLSFWTYRARGQVDLQRSDAIEQMLLRATLGSQTSKMVPNLAGSGIYAIHGDRDDNVFPAESREMVDELATFHKDFVYHEEPGVGHWWDHSDEPGADCVDWPPLFDFFARHARPQKRMIRRATFQTPNPGISAWHHWAGIDAQTKICRMSRFDILLDPELQRFTGTTENVARLVLDVAHLDKTRPVRINLDGQRLGPIPFPEHSGKIWFYRTAGRWSPGAAPGPELKRSQRYGVFKDAFQNRMLFVYGTNGNSEENTWAFEKARYDAEYLWYEGNSSVDIIRDIEFDPRSEPHRNVILYGNATTNAAWKALLGNSPVQVFNGELRIGDRALKGDDLGCIFIRPRPDSDRASVGVISGTGPAGMRTNDRRPAFAPGFAYPDLAVYSARRFRSG